MTLKITKKYFTLGGCLVLRARWLNRRTYSGEAMCYLGGCVIVIGNGLDLGNGVSSGSLYNCQGWPSTMTLTLAGSDGSLA